MRWLSHTRTRLSQPQGSFRVDLGNPLSRGLSAVVLPGSAWVNGSHRSTSFHNSDTTLKAGQAGRAWGTAAVSAVTGLKVSGDAPILRLGGECSAILVALGTSGGSGNATFLGAASQDNFGYTAGGAPKIQGSSGARLTGSVSMTPGKLHTLAYGWAFAIGRTAFVGVDGELTTGSTSNIGVNTTLSVLGHSTVGGYGHGANTIFLCLLYDRLLELAEARALSANPYQVIESERRIWLPVSAVGGAPALTGANCSQANASSTGAIVQRHVLTGASCVQANASTASTIVQRHALAAAPSSQANAGSTGAAVQRHTLAGAACSQASTSAAGAVQQRHVLAGANASQANSCSTGAIGSAGQLQAAPSSQANSSSAAAITQRHKLSAAGCSQANTSPGAAIVQRHQLGAANASQANSCTAGAVATRHGLQAAPSVQDSVAAGSAIVQRHVLQAAACIQANSCSSPYLIVGELALPPGCEITAVRPRSLEIEASAPRAIEIAARRPRRLEIGP